MHCVRAQTLCAIDRSSSSGCSVVSNSAGCACGYWQPWCLCLLLLDQSSSRLPACMQAGSRDQNTRAAACACQSVAQRCAGSACGRRVDSTNAEAHWQALVWAAWRSCCWCAASLGGDGGRLHSPAEPGRAQLIVNGLCVLFASHSCEPGTCYGNDCGLRNKSAPAFKDARRLPRPPNPQTCSHKNPQAAAGDPPAHRQQQPWRRRA